MNLIILLAAAFAALLVSRPSPPPAPTPRVIIENFNNGRQATQNGAPWQAQEPVKLPPKPDIIITKPADPEPKIPPVTAVYEKRLCSDSPPAGADHIEEKIHDFIFPLTEGCFAGPITVPALWTRTKVQKSQEEGDWASVWCEGHAEPSVIHPYTEPFTSQDLADCGRLSFEGKGSIHFIALDVHHGTYMIHPFFPEPPSQKTQ